MFKKPIGSQEEEHRKKEKNKQETKVKWQTSALMY